jgi:hypothetical protein
VVVLGALVFTIFIGSQTDPREAAGNEIGRRLMAMPEFQARYGDVDSPERGLRARPDSSGRPRSPASTTQACFATGSSRRSSSRTRTTAPARRSCARRSADQARELAKTLDEDQFNELLEVTFKAFEAELKGTPARRPTTRSAGASSPWRTRWASMR